MAALDRFHCIFFSLFDLHVVSKYKNFIVIIHKGRQRSTKVNRVRPPLVL